jgi:hypothetical protein
MAYKFSIVLILYAVSAVLDAYLGIITINPYRSLLFRVAAVATVTAVFVMLVRKGGTLKIFPLILASLALSLAAVFLGGYNDVAITAVCVKAAATVLTVKPDLVEIEIETEEEEKNSQETSDAQSNGR